MSETELSLAALALTTALDPSTNSVNPSTANTPLIMGGVLKIAKNILEEMNTGKNFEDAVKTVRKNTIASF